MPRRPSTTESPSRRYPRRRKQGELPQEQETVVAPAETEPSVAVSNEVAQQTLPTSNQVGALVDQELLKVSWMLFCETVGFPQDTDAVRRIVLKLRQQGTDPKKALEMIDAAVDYNFAKANRELHERICKVRDEYE